MKNFNSKRWTWQAQDARNVFIYIMYIRTKKIFLENLKKAIDKSKSGAIMIIKKGEHKGASEKSPHKSDARTQAKRAGGVYFEN